MTRPQVSLLSATIAFLLAGGLLGINAAAMPGRMFNAGAYDHHEIHIQLQSRGWPCVYQEWADNGITDYHAFDWGALALNIVFGGAVLIFAGAGVEMLVRRRKP